MVKTTISIQKSTKMKISEFKLPNETYDELLLRLYENACKRQLEFLNDRTNCVTLDEARDYFKSNYNC